MVVAPDSGGRLDRTVGAQVRAARLARGLGLRDFARRLQLSPATLSQIENGHTTLSVRRLHHIADSLSITARELLERDLVPAPSEPGPGKAGIPTSPSTPRPISNLVSVADWRTYQPLEFDSVLAAALDAFITVGYHGSTMREIATRCGLSVSGIYHYYPSKQQMLMTLLELTMGELLARARAAREAGNDPVERFSFLIEHLALFHTHRLELGFVGASEMRSLDPDNHDTIAQLRHEQQHMVDAEAQAAIRTGQFRSTHPDEAARAAVTMCTALPTWWRRGGRLSPEQIAKQYVGFAFDLLTTDRPRH